MITLPFQDSAMFKIMLQKDVLFDDFDYAKLSVDTLLKSLKNIKFEYKALSLKVMMIVVISLEETSL